MTCSVREFLAAQDLNEVFESFKKHELEFESYLRPLMQEVVRETSHEAEDNIKATWSFICKNVCKDHAVVRQLVKEDERNRFVSKIIKMRQQ